MKRRLISILLIIFALGTLPMDVYAEAEQNDVNNVIYFDDGSYIVFSIEETNTRAAYTKTATKKTTYYDGSGNVEWEARLQASFTYNGATSSCTSADCTVDISENAWYVVSESTSYSGSTATTNLTMGEKLLFITIAKYDYTITLTCDKDGNLS